MSDLPLIDHPDELAQKMRELMAAGEGSEFADVRVVETKFMEGDWTLYAGQNAMARVTDLAAVMAPGVYLSGRTLRLREP